MQSIYIAFSHLVNVGICSKHNYRVNNCADALQRRYNLSHLWGTEGSRGAGRCKYGRERAKKNGDDKEQAK
jgi:hypothetical protein